LKRVEEEKQKRIEEEKKRKQLEELERQKQEQMKLREREIEEMKKLLELEKQKRLEEEQKRLQKEEELKKLLQSGTSEQPTEGEIMEHIESEQGSDMELAQEAEPSSEDAGEDQYHTEDTTELESKVSVYDTEDKQLEEPNQGTELQPDTPISNELERTAPKLPLRPLPKVGGIPFPLPQPPKSPKKPSYSVKLPLRPQGPGKKGKVELKGKMLPKIGVGAIKVLPPLPPIPKK